MSAEARCVRSVSPDADINPFQSGDPTFGNARTVHMPVSNLPANIAAACTFFVMVCVSWMMFRTDIIQVIRALRKVDAHFFAIIATMVAVSVVPTGLVWVLVKLRTRDATAALRKLNEQRQHLETVAREASASLRRRNSPEVIPTTHDISQH